jgi:hypothetical protein
MEAAKLLVDPWKHRLNVELDLQHLFGLHVHLCTAVLNGEDPAKEVKEQPTPTNLSATVRRVLQSTRSQ